MSDEPRNPLADTTEDEYGANEGEVSQEDYDEIEDVDVDESAYTLAPDQENE